MSFFEDLVDRAGRLLGIVTTTGQATIATEATAQTLATTLATQATLSTRASEATLSTRASEATLAGIAANGLTADLIGAVEAGNTNLGTLGAGLTWTGTWVLLDGRSQVVTSFKSSQAGTFTMFFSSDGITSDRTIGPYTLAANVDSPQPLAPIRSYYRCSYTNTSGSSANLRIETRLLTVPGLFQTRVSDTLSTLSTATLSRSVLFGLNPSGSTFGNVGINADALNVSIASPSSAIGEVITAEHTPRVQFNAVYGLLATDTQALSATGGTTVAAASLFTCATGLSVGGYGVIRSRRLVAQRPGQGIIARVNAAFTTGVASSLQFAGLFTATDGRWFGYNGATFGITRRISGACAIHRLTITVGAGIAENMTVTLNGVAFVIASGGVLLSTTATAERIAEAGTFTGWTHDTSPTSNGATVTFIQSVPAATAGAFTLTSTGTAAGTFATVQVGAANDDTTGFVPQTSWNVDVMDGSASASNPSGVLLDKTKLNLYEITFSGGGSIEWRVLITRKRSALVHVTELQNVTTTTTRNTTYRVGWTAASLGSTTALAVTGAIASAFVEGPLVSSRDPFSARIQTFNSGLTEYVAIAFRVRGEFGGTTNQREIVPQNVFVGVDETTTRIVNVRVILNPTLTGTVNWGYVNEAISCVERATPTTLAPSGGSDIATVIAASGASATINLAALTVRLEPGDVIALAVQTVSSTAVITASMNWDER